MEKTITGLHHVTCITAKPQAHIDFYTKALGMRLVKLTVNYDDPSTYHTYFGDENGSPGTLMTFFPWPHARPGRIGAGQVGATSFAIPEGSSKYWISRLANLGIDVDSEVEERFGELVVTLRDPDSMPIELIESPADSRPSGAARFGVPAEHAVKGFHSVSLFEREIDLTGRLLTETLGLSQVAEESGRIRYAALGGKAGGLLDIVVEPNMARAMQGAGTVHHVALRTPDDTQQTAWYEMIAGLGYSVSSIIDRQYFHSIYFREPGGVLFEIATDPPGMTVDEPVEKLGHGLLLPPQYEGHRNQIEASLPRLVLPESGAIVGGR